MHDGGGGGGSGSLSDDDGNTHLQSSDRAIPSRKDKFIFLGAEDF